MLSTGLVNRGPRVRPPHPAYENRGATASRGTKKAPLAHVAQSVEAPDSSSGQYPFESDRGYSHATITNLLCGVIVVLILALLGAQDAKAAAASPITRGCGVYASVVDRRACIIRRVFGPVHGAKAVRVAWCESRLDPRARNGQYLGVMQMGRRERARFGHSRTVLGQALAARRYHRLAGWRPWSCA